MAATVASVPVQQFFANDGTPLAGGFLYTYVAGLSTPQTVYSNSARTVAWANPIPLDAYGRVPGEIFPPDSPSVKYVLKDANGVTIWTADNVPAVKSA